MKPLTKYTPLWWVCFWMFGIFFEPVKTAKGAWNIFAMFPKMLWGVCRSVPSIWRKAKVDGAKIDLLAKTVYQRPDKN
jgi:hypothetical protein